MSSTIEKNPFEAVILDLDGVVTQTARVHARAWRQVFDEYLVRRRAEGNGLFDPFDMDRDYDRHVEGKACYDAVRALLASRGIQLPPGVPADAPGFGTVCALGNRKNEIFICLVEEGGVDVYKDTVEQVRRWRRQGLKTAVVSSSRICDEILRATGLHHLFDVRVDGVEAERLHLAGEPAPDTFLEAARRLGVSPAKAIVVQDAYCGVEAGRRGHFAKVVGVARKQSAVLPLSEAGADVVVQTLGELSVP